MDENDQFIDIILTDLQMHVTKPRKPVSLGRSIKKTLTSKKDGRAYSRDMSVSKNGKFTFSIPLGKEFYKLKEKAEREGKQLRLLIPGFGLYVFTGKDMIEYIKAQKKTAFDKTGN